MILSCLVQADTELMVAAELVPAWAVMASAEAGADAVIARAPLASAHGNYTHQMTISMEELLAKQTLELAAISLCTMTRNWIIVLVNLYFN